MNHVTEELQKLAEVVAEKAKQEAATVRAVADKARAAAELAEYQARCAENFFASRMTFENLAAAAGCRIYFNEQNATLAFYMPIFGDALTKLIKSLYPTIEKEKEHPARERRSPESEQRLAPAPESDDDA